MASAEMNAEVPGRSHRLDHRVGRHLLAEQLRLQVLVLVLPGLDLEAQIHFLLRPAATSRVVRAPDAVAVAAAGVLTAGVREVGAVAGVSSLQVVDPHAPAGLPLLLAV